MHAQEGHEQDQSRQPAGITRTVRMFARRHRTVFSLAAVALVASVAVIPYAAAASQDTASNQSDQQATSSQQQKQNDLGGDSAMPKTEVDANSNRNQTNVTINGQSVDTPENGSYHKITEDENGRTEVKVESRQTSSGDGGSNSNSSSVNINVNSSNSSD